MKIKKLLSTFAAMAIAASSFAGLGISANAAEQPTEVIATSSAKISSGTITAVDSETESLYMHYYSKALSEGMVAFALEEGNYYDVDHILKAELSTYDWSTAASNKRGRTLNGSLYALSDTTLATKTTSGTALWTQTGSISNYLATATNSVGTAENKKIDVTEYMQSLSNETNAVAFLYTVDTSSVCDWNIATQNVSGKEPTLLLTYGQAVTLTVKLNDTAKANVPVVIGEKTYTTDENGQINFVADAGTYNYTIEQSADYNAKSGSVTVSSADVNEDIVLEESTATPCTLTLKYVDADGNELKTAVATTDAFVDVAYELAETEKADFTYTNESGIEYTATVTTTSVTPTSATATCDVTCTLVEKEYTTTISTAPYAKIVISGTATSGESFTDTTVYSNHQGNATTTLKQGTYNAAVSKGGYNSSATNAFTVTTSGGTATVTLTATNSNVLFYEDFATTGFDNKGVGLYGNATTSGAAYMRLLDGACQQVNAGSGSRSNTMTFKYDNTESAAYVIEFDVSATYGSYTGDTTIKSGDVTLLTLSAAATGKVSALYSDGKVVSTFKVDGSDDVVTTTDYTGNMFTEMTINAIRGVNVTIDNIVIKKAPALTIATSAPTGITAPTTTTAYEITSGTKAETATDVDLTDVQTVYIKVENIDDTSVMPAVVVGDTTYAPTYKYTANTDGYFVYQFVGIDLTGAKVTYTGAADKTVSSES